MKNIFRNLGYLVATSVAAFALLTTLPGSGGPLSEAQASGSPCAGGAVDMKVDFVSWNDGAGNISYGVDLIPTLGGSSSGTIKLYGVLTDDSDGSLEDEISVTSDSPRYTFHLNGLGGGHGQYPVKLRVKLERPGCTTIVKTVAYARPATGAGSGVTYLGVQDKMVEDDTTNDDKITIKPVVSYDSTNYSDLEYEVRYRYNSSTSWNSISPVTPDNTEEDEYEIDDQQRPIVDGAKIELIVDTGDHDKHEVEIRVIDPNDNDKVLATREVDFE